MSRAKPIWHKVTACNYKSDKSFGSLNTSEVEILVGSSASNSHHLIKHFTTRRFNEFGECIFRFGVEVNGAKFVIAEKIFTDNNGKAGTLLESKYHLSQFQDNEPYCEDCGCTEMLCGHNKRG